MVPKRPLLVNRRVAKNPSEQVSNRTGSYTLLGVAYGVLTVDNLPSSTVASIFCLRLQDPSSPYHSFHTTPPALCLLQRTSTTMCRPQPLRLSCLSIILSSNVEMNWFGLVSRSFQSSERGSRPSTFAVRCLRELVSAVRRRSFLLCIGHTIVVPPDGSWYTFHPRFLVNFNFRGHRRPT